MNFKSLKIGDRVDRYHGSGFWMEMEVADIKDSVLVCSAIIYDKNGPELGKFTGGWTFDVETGMEEDEDLKWGVKYGITGSYLKLKE